MCPIRFLELALTKEDFHQKSMYVHITWSNRCQATFKEKNTKTVWDVMWVKGYDLAYGLGEWESIIKNLRRKICSAIILSSQE